MLTSKPVRAVAAAALSLGLAAGLSACGTPQTLQPYTPAEGAQIDARVQGTVPLKLRNVMLLAKESGKATLIGSVISPEADTLKGATGRVITFKGDNGSTFPAATADIKVNANEAVNLLDQPAIELAASDLAPGQTAEVTLMFEKAGAVSLRVPVVDGKKADYKTASPKPGAGAATPTATPS
ncbi:hypothetical protein GCM10027418_09390 [Mariniluteicoccus endophyticus]